MNLKKWLTTNFTEIHTEKLAKILLAIFIMVFSIFVLAYKIPESGYVQETLESLEESKTTVMEFSGATIAVSLAITALPDDFGSSLADTLADMNKYFIFVFAVLYVEKLIVIEGIKLSFLYIIPFACGLYILSVLSGEDIIEDKEKSIINIIKNLLPNLFEQGNLQFESVEVFWENCYEK